MDELLVDRDVMMVRRYHVTDAMLVRYHMTTTGRRERAMGRQSGQTGRHAGRPNHAGGDRGRRHLRQRVVDVLIVRSEQEATHLSLIHI